MECTLVSRLSLTVETLPFLHVHECRDLEETRQITVVGRKKTD